MTTTTDTDFRKISNSEATDWATCKRLYLNAYVKRLAPKTLRGPLAIGTVGHLGLERYYKGRIAGEPHETAISNAQSVITQEIPLENYDLEDILKAREGIERFFEYYGDESETWEFLKIEEEFSMGIPYRNNYDYTMKLDLLVRNRNTGEIVLRDFKFCYDFWKPRKFKLRGQFPKYLLALKSNGINVDTVMIDQIRYREMKDKTDLTRYLKRDKFTISNPKIRNIINDHVQFSDEIMHFRSLSPEQQEKKATRLLVDPICKSCGFAELCEIELEDGKTDLFIEEVYKENTYGYNKHTDETLAGVL